MFWPGPSTPNFHQNYENPNIPLKEVKHKDSDIFRRCTSLGSNFRGGFKCFEPIDFSIAKPRICDQSKEITASVCTRNRVSGAFGQSKYNDFSSATRQIDRNKLSMSKISKNPSAYNFRVDSTVRKTFVFCASSFIWTFVKEVPSGFPNKIFEKCNLWKKNLFRFFVFGRTKMVESKFASIKWKIYSKN